MIVIENVTFKNFLSTGQVTQSINFNNTDLTLILGENLDLGGDGARNGTGKTTLMQALCYGLFGEPINNIKLDNLINRTNAKKMLVTVDFSIGGKKYRVERGRKPNVLRFYVNDEKTKDDAQGENKETQAEIERILCMTPDLFKHIVSLNTYSVPFLAMKISDQRVISEQLLGVTLLSEKADRLKTLIKETKEAIHDEDIRIKAVTEANKRVSDQIESLRRREKLWQTQHADDLQKLILEYDELSKIDIDAELQLHKDLVEFNTQTEINDSYKNLLARQKVWLKKRQEEVDSLQVTYDTLNKIDIVAELQSHKDLLTFNAKKTELSTLDNDLSRTKTALAKEQKTLAKLEKEVATLKDHKCYACGQDFHDESHDKVLAEKKKLLDEAEKEIGTLTQTISDLQEKINLIGDLGEQPKTHYKSESDAVKHESEVTSLLEKINSKQSEADPYHDQIEEIKPFVKDLGSKPSPHYSTEAEAVKHSSRVETLTEQILKKNSEVDPYSEQIKDMEKNAIQEVNFEEINRLNQRMEHQKFILDLLTSKDSFVRKKIIDQNLSYLNRRLTHYLDKMGLPHQVEFKNDLSVEITELGRELDFHNLSRGEMSRVILSLSWAFLDVWEALYQPINLMLIDELLDGGMDTIGVENSMKILKDMNRNRKKSIWLISHREELVSRVGSVLKVVKENGFSTYQSDET